MSTLVITRATVHDGRGGAGRVADVVVRDGVVTAVGPGAGASVVEAGRASSARGAAAGPAGRAGGGAAEHAPGRAPRVVDGRGLEVLPGFVDVHAHDDAALFRPGGTAPKTAQGVTTTIVGNCGQGAAPSPADPADRSLEQYSLPVLGEFPDRRWATFGDYVETLAREPLGLHARALVPHAPVRAAVLGMVRRPADAAETARIAGAVGDALDAGALGVSLGLMYAPGDAADRPELLAIAREVAARDGLLVAHVRNEADGLRASVDELASLGLETGARVHVSHLKVTGPRNVGGMGRIIDRLDALRDQGLDVSADVYPYDAGSTTVASLFPPSTADRGVASLLEALSDPVSRRAVLAGLDRPWEGTALENQWAAVGPTRILLAGFARPENAGLEGRSVADIAVELGGDPRELLADLVLAERGALTVIVFHTDVEGMRTALAWPHTLVGSDGLPRETGTVHPRLYGTFARALDVYSGPGPSAVLSREEAVHRMSVAAHERFRLGADRARGGGGGSGASGGTAAGPGAAGPGAVVQGAVMPGGVVPGAVADLQLVDPAAYADRATYAEPRRSPSGVLGVWVAGELVAGELAARPVGG
ncbi:N-acyl-D-amino-acid deacylase family protein [Frigoribacterium faeni]|uniref:N-acyl-D-amino-acid deacylase family protein n=1 Tax=Frigoribacterium faeni TaxID=145483 RepID=UPI00141B37A4|nr:amidohydrolase family protein [Frigoribacterium faeni]NIJ05192.1 dihydroorotase/N-acyl-D-amino-acid deacylase [Frigoribacterium faeni]